MSQNKKGRRWLGFLLELLIVAGAGVFQSISRSARRKDVDIATASESQPSQVITEAAYVPPDVWPHRIGWSPASPEMLPAPTYTPALMAFGIVLLALGLITRWYVSAVGAGAFVASLWLWIGELRHEP